MRSAAATLVLLFGCTVGESLTMRAPDAGGAASILFVFEGGAPLVQAVEPREEDAPLELVLPDASASAIEAFAFLYRRPLAFYGLTPGRVPAHTDDARSCGLSEPTAVLAYDRSADAWTKPDAFPARAMRRFFDPTFDCAPVDLCRTFETEFLQLGTHLNAFVHVPLDDETALIGSEDGRFFEITRQGVTPRADLDGLPGRAGAIGEDGEIWLGGRGSRVARGRRDGGFVEETYAPEDNDTAAIGLGPETLVLGIEHESPVRTSTIRLYRRDAADWTLIFEKVVDSASVRRSDIEWVDHRALITFGGFTLLLYDGASIDEFTLTDVRLFDARAHGIVNHPEFGLAMASSDGFLYTPQDEALTVWNPTPDTALGNSMDGIALAYEGILYGGPDGPVRQFYPGAIPCDVQVLVRSDADRLHQYGDAVLVAGGNPDRSEPNTVTWLVP